MSNGKTMKVTGFLRKIDALGRICLPIEFRRRESLKTDDKVELLLTDDGLLMRKFAGDSRTAAALNNLKDAIREDAGIEDKDKGEVLVQVAALEQAIATYVKEGEKDDA